MEHKIGFLIVIRQDKDREYMGNVGLYWHSHSSFQSRAMRRTHRAYSVFHGVDQDTEPCIYALVFLGLAEEQRREREELFS